VGWASAIPHAKHSSWLLLFGNGAFDGADDLRWSLVILVLAVIILGPLLGLLYFVTGPRRKQLAFAATESPRLATTESQRPNGGKGTRVLMILVLLSLFYLYRGLFSH
jgi:hypothetical protein